MGLNGRFAHKPYAISGHLIVVAPEIIGVQKQKDTPSGLVANPAALLIANCFGQQQLTTRSGGQCPRRCHSYPAFGLAQDGVFNQVKVQFVDVEADGIVIVINDYSDQSKGLRHDLRTLD